MDKLLLLEIMARNKINSLYEQIVSMSKKIAKISEEFIESVCRLRADKVNIRSSIKRIEQVKVCKLIKKIESIISIIKKISNRYGFKLNLDIKIDSLDYEEFKLSLGAAMVIDRIDDQDYVDEEICDDEEMDPEILNEDDGGDEDDGEGWY